MLSTIKFKFASRRSLKRLAQRSFSTAEKTKWKSVVGLEVHAQISAASKLFSGASTKFSAPVNSNVAFFDCSLPGTLPVLNKKCVESGVLTALALNCRINPVSMFDRKHYFYADLPTGYQITQQRAPLAVDGGLDFHVVIPGTNKPPYKSHVRIKQLQLEQDSGKSLHDTDRSLVDLNRAGVPLMELVFEPDLSNGEEAASLVKELIAILLRIQTCSCKMEEGALRVDANVSIHKPGEPLGTRTEVKNIGSVRGVAGAVGFEINRQIQIKESGGNIVNETRAWDAVQKVTVAMRDKEQQQDYRYMPEPNLPPLHVAMGPVAQGCVNADDLRKSLPELPQETRLRLQHESGLTLEQAVRLVNDSSLLLMFEECVKRRKLSPKLTVNFMINEYLTSVYKAELEPEDLHTDPDTFSELVELLETKVINRSAAKVLLEEIIGGSKDRPSQMVKDRSLMQITDERELTKLCEEAISENPKGVEQYRKGKAKVFKSFMGSVAKKSQQRADMGQCAEILQKLLDKK